MKASVFMARYLKYQGLQRAFGLPGGEAVPLMEGLRQVEIPFVLTHHESAAGYMAATTGHLTGVPGLCIVTRGPGAVNMVSAVAMAHLDRLPLIAVSGDLEPAQVGSFTHQWLDLVSLFKPITKASMRLLAGEIESALPEAVALAKSGRPGPVYLAFPASEANKDLPHLGDMTVEEIGSRFTPAEAVESSPDLGPLVEAVRAARAPIIMAGLGVASEKAGADLVATAEHLRVPVTVTAQSKGYFPEDHPLFAGTFGVYTDAPVYDLIQESDLILAIGLDGVEFFKPWKIGIPVASVGHGGADDPSYSPRITADGKLAQILAGIRSHVDGKAGWEAGRIERCRAEVEAVMTPEVVETGTEISPQATIAELRSALPRDGILTVDVGAHKLVAMSQWPAFEPETFLTTNGLSGMGYAVPAAIAAKLARPEKPVAALIGDGGFLMFTGELETLARLQLPVTVVVMNDGALSSIKVKQEKRGYPSVGTEFGRPDYAGIARDFGLLGFKVSTREHLRGALREALASGRGAVVEVATLYDEYLRYQ
ncbi:MAG TPA: thiamine pyrophosphate-binding protein [Chloroflexota bacterium]